MEADANGYSYAENNIFKGCYGSANCSSTADNSLLLFFLLPDILPHSCWVNFFSPLPCHPKRAGQRSDWCVDIAQQGLGTD